MIFNKKKFQQLREARGLTLDDIAAACGCSKQTVQKWEKHPYLKPKSNRIPQLASILHCKESDLAQYGPIEKAMDDLNKEDEILRKRHSKDALEDLKYRLLRELIKSDMLPGEKDKALKIVENFDFNG